MNKSRHGLKGQTANNQVITQTDGEPIAAVAKCTEGQACDSRRGQIVRAAREGLPEGNAYAEL